MTEHPHKPIRELRQQVSDDAYEVDSRAVADAIVRRRWSVTVAMKPAKTRVIAAPEWSGIEALAA